MNHSTQNTQTHTHTHKHTHCGKCQDTATRPGRHAARRRRRRAASRPGPRVETRRATPPRRVAAARAHTRSEPPRDAAAPPRRRHAARGSSHAPEGVRVRSSRLSGCSSTPVPSATALRWQLGSIASPSETARRWPSSTSFGAAKQLSQHESSVSTSPSLPPAASAAALPAAVRAPRRGPAARDVGGIPACVAGHLATASTEQPRTKSGGASLAWRAFGRLINKSGPFFRAPPRQNILRRQAPSRKVFSGQAHARFSCGTWVLGELTCG